MGGWKNIAVSNVSFVIVLQSVEPGTEDM